MSLELDGGKHVLAMTVDGRRRGSPWLLVARGPGRTEAWAGEYEVIE